MPRAKPSLYSCVGCDRKFDTYEKYRRHFKNLYRYCIPMERLMKNILRFKPDTIEKLRDLLEDEDVGLESLEERLVEKLSELKEQVKLCIHYLYFLLTFVN